jgi:MFS family permease
MPHMATQAAVPSASKVAVRSLIVLVLINIVNFYDRQVPGALAEPIRREFGLTDTQLGLIGTAFTILYAIVGIPLGRMADRGSRKKILAIGMAVWGALTGTAAWVRSLPMLIASRFGVAVGEAVCAPAATSWIGDLFPPDKRSRPLAIFMLGVPIGLALSSFLSGPIAQLWGWRLAMILAGLPALLLIPALSVLPEPQRGASELTKVESPQSPWQLFQIPTFCWIVASGVLVNFNLYAMGAFLTALLQRIHHINVARAGIYTGIIYMVGGVLGGLFGGSWGDRVVRRRSDGRLRIAAIAALIAAPLAFIGFRQGIGSLALAVVMLTAAYGLFNMYYGLVYASLQDIVTPALRATAMAFYFLVMYLGGASFGPYITGRLSDKLAHRAAEAAGSVKVTEAFRAIGLQQAMLVVPVLALGLALVLWAGSKSIVKDTRRI